MAADTGTINSCAEVSRKLNGDHKKHWGQEGIFKRSAIAGLISNVDLICGETAHNSGRNWTNVYEGLKESFDMLFKNIKNKFDKKSSAQQSGEI